MYMYKVHDARGSQRVTRSRCQMMI